MTIGALGIKAAPVVAKVLGGIVKDAATWTGYSEVASRGAEVAFGEKTVSEAMPKANMEEVKGLGENFKGNLDFFIKAESIPFITAGIGGIIGGPPGLIAGYGAGQVAKNVGMLGLMGYMAAKPAYDLVQFNKADKYFDRTPRKDETKRLVEPRFYDDLATAAIERRAKTGGKSVWDDTKIQKSLQDFFDYKQAYYEAYAEDEDFSPMGHIDYWKEQGNEFIEGVKSGAFDYEDYLDQDQKNYLEQWRASKVK